MLLRPSQIELDEGLDILCCIVMKFPLEIPTGVVDQHIYRAKGTLGSGNQGTACLLDCHIGWDREDLDPGRTNVSGHLFQLEHRTCSQGQIDALLRQCVGNKWPDATRGTGNDSGLAVFDHLSCSFQWPHPWQNSSP
jgi:hypothetical protein